MNVIARLVIIVSLILLHFNTVQSLNNSKNDDDIVKQTIEENTAVNTVEADRKNLDLVLDQKTLIKNQIKDLESIKEDLKSQIEKSESLKRIVDHTEKDSESLKENFESLNDDTESLVIEQVDDSLTDKIAKVEDVLPKISPEKSTTITTKSSTTTQSPTTTLSTTPTTTKSSTTTLTTTITRKTTSPTTTNDNSLDFSFRKCCKSQTDILHLVPSGKPVCETLHGLELPDLVPRNMGGEMNNIPACINGTLTVVDNFLHPSAEGYINVLNSDRTITKNVSVKEEDFCNDFAIEDGSFITTVALFCERNQDECTENPQSCINLCCNYDHLCPKPKWEFYQDKHMISTQLSCNNSAANLTLKDDGVYLLDRKLNLGEYCIEPGFDSNPIMIEDNNIQVIGQTCMLPNIDYTFIMNSRIVIAVLLCLSVVSLLFSLLIHIFVPELHASMFGWMKISHLSSMFIAFTILFGMFVGGLELVFNHNILCKILGFTMQYFFIASFFWVNVMSFDIWRTFRHIRGFNNNKTTMKLDQRRKFIYYSVYAWGSSFLVSAITILMESLPKDLTEHLTTPNIGVHSCFFETNWSKWVYFHGPVSILLTANIIFFLMSSWSLMMGVWAPSASDRIKRQTKQRFKVVVELFFGMGFTWVAEIISWALSWGMGTHAILKTSIIFDIANALQGFIIFIIVVLKSRTIKSIRKFVLGIPVSAHNSIKTIERKFSKSTVQNSGSSVAGTSVHRNP